MRIHTAFTALLIFVLVYPLLATDYVEVTGNVVNIRTGPELNTTSVGQGTKGQIFVFANQEDDWYHIICFSGEIRYVHKDFSAYLKGTDLKPEHFFALPQDNAKLNTVYTEIMSAQNKAKSMAEGILPSDRDMERHERLRTLLLDRDVLKVFKKYDLHPALYSRLLEIANEQGW